MANVKPETRETAVPVPGPCWEWQKYRQPDGYGQVWNAGAMRPAHRLAWEVFEGEIPKGMHVLHRCDNPACCNTAHLFLGTRSDNMRDMHAKGRGNPPRLKGSNHGMAKLTEADIPEIFKLRKEGKTQQAIAEVFEVGQHQISDILNRKKWKHVPVPVDLACEVNG